MPNENNEMRYSLLNNSDTGHLLESFSVSVNERCKWEA